jgi:transposase
MPTETGPGMTVRDVARRYRVGKGRVRAWISRGELRAVNRRDIRSGRPSWVVPPEALAEFESGRAAAVRPKPQRRRKKTAAVDYYP